MTECPVQQTDTASKQALWLLLNRQMLIKDSNELQRITWRWQQVKDALFSEKWWLYAYTAGKEQAFIQYSKLNDTQKQELIKLINDTATNVLHNPTINEVRNITPIANALRIAGYDKDLITAVEFIESRFNVNLVSKDSYKIWQTINLKRWVEWIYDNVHTWRYAFLMEPWVKPNTIQDSIKSHLRMAWVIKDSDIKRWVDDFMGNPLWESQAFKFVWALKQLYTNIKFWVHTVAWPLLCVSNMVMWNLLLMSKKRWLEKIVSSKAIDILLDDFNFLKSENKVLSGIANTIDMNGKNRYFKLIDWLAKRIPLIWDKWRAMANAILQWWVHQAADFIMEEKVMRVAVAQALAAKWINAMNIDEFAKLLDEWKLDAWWMDKLRINANVYYHDFFSNSNNVALNRHRFSKRWMFTTLQWYVLNRASWIYNGLKTFSNVWKEWKIKTRWDFVEHLYTDNQELKTFIYNTLLAAKMSIYADIIVNAHDYDNDDKLPYKYMLGMSDYLSSLSSTFWFNILTAPLEWLDKYYDYTAATGKSEEMIEWISVAALNTIAQTIRMLFREWNIISAFWDAWLSFLKTGDLDFAAEVAGTAFEKISDWLWRYSLLPWVDTYWQTPIEEDDDIIWRIFMTYDKTNTSMRNVQKLRWMADAESIINDKWWYLLRLLQYLPVVKSFTESNKSTGWNEARYKYLQDMMQSDEVLQQLWKWELPADLLSASPEITNSLYNDLLSFDYSYKDYLWKWEHDVADPNKSYGIYQMEESTFVENIANKVFGSREAMDKALIKNKADIKSILKVLAASEANTPWSSRIVLSYLAKKDFDSLKEQVYWSKYVKSADIPDAEENQLKATVLEKWYPYLYISDRTSQYKAVREYLNYSRQDIYAWIQNDNDLKQLINTMAWSDMLVMLEWDTWNVDANNIKNIFNTAVKYVSNTNDRINLVNHTLWVISWMKSPSNEVKQLMKVGVLWANIDFYNELKQDEVTKLLYFDDINKFENIVWWVSKNINMVGNSLAMWELDGWAKRQYYASSGTSYKKPQYSNSNRNALNNFVDKVNKTFKEPTETKVKQIYSNPREIGALKPKWYDIYVKIYDREYKAISAWLVKTSAKWYPSDLIEWLKFTVKWKRNTTIKSTRWTYIPRWKRKQTSTATLSDLPGGTNDISSD